MRLVTFHGGDGRVRFGVVADTDTATGIVDLDSRTPADVTSVRTLLASGRLDDAAAAATAEPDVALADVTLLPPVPDPAKILAIGLNYAEHRAEGGEPEVSYPTIFTRFPDSQVGHGERLRRPDASDKYDYEGELAVVIGRPCFGVAEQDAMSYVAGYSAYNDGSVRDWQRHTSQFIPGKNFYRSGAFGPWLVTADEVPDINQHRIETRLNGQVVQHAPLTDMIFKIPALIAYISTFTPLGPGDVLVTGTPSGVGIYRKPPLLLNPGDVVEVEISCVGVLRNEVAAQADVAWAAGS
jgi:2-keto-4-pentenoate hydratase/2-oxohepta-3-ene-1,7-dioic acid hydratase in catechol pathway